MGHICINWACRGFHQDSQKVLDGSTDGSLGWKQALCPGSILNCLQHKLILGLIAEGTDCSYWQFLLTLDAWSSSVHWFWISTTAPMVRIPLVITVLGSLCTEECLIHSWDIRGQQQEIVWRVLQVRRGSDPHWGGQPVTAAHFRNPLWRALCSCQLLEDLSHAGRNLCAAQLQDLKSLNIRSVTHTASWSLLSH